jgi:hypothetical protein
MRSKNHIDFFVIANKKGHGVHALSIFQALIGKA